MKTHLLFLAISILILTSCQRDKHPSEPVLVTITKDTVNHDEDPLMDQLSKAEALNKLLDHKVILDTLLDAITHQDRVKLITKLSDYFDDKEQKHIYKDSTYIFKLDFYRDPSSGDNQTIFYDGDKAIKFKDYQVTCPDPAHCNQYAYNADNSLDSPIIVEVCGSRFLYSSVMHYCNGIGCGTNLFMIYDIANKKPTFIENYRINYKGYYLSDFDGDSIPDLMVMSQIGDMDTRFDAENTTLSLYGYKYKGGKFMSQSSLPLYRLFGFTAHVFYPDIYSLIQTPK